MGNQYTNAWTQQEIDFLRKNYEKMFAEEIGKKLGRTKRAVHKKAFMLNIKGNKSGKMRERIKKFNSTYWKGKSRKGRKVTWGNKISHSLIIRKRGRGKNNPMWKGGIAYKPYGSGFTNRLKTFIRFRDKYKCRGCGIPQHELKRLLCIHHIDYNKNNHNPDNLISLCSICHAKTGFLRKDWTKYFMRKLKNANS
jgi:5-methylcytosine-specific restriction endonuclease McrA